MASIRRRGAKWQVQVRRLGSPPLSRSFLKQSDAIVWARQIEGEIDRGDLTTDLRQIRNTTLADLLARYREIVTPKKRGREVERIRITKLLDHMIARRSLAAITPAVVAQYRDERLAYVQPDTVRRELTILRHVFEVAIRDWGVAVPRNPVACIKKPAPAPSRDRRLNDDEFARLLAGCRRSRFLAPAIRLAVETGMRRSELLGLLWSCIDLAKATLHIANTKNGVPRTIPLSSAALDVLRALPQNDGRVLPMSANALRLAWERLRKRVGINDLHFHDLRHEAISRFFEKGLSVPEVALISGHRDVRQLFRYTHLKPEDVAKKLA